MDASTEPGVRYCRDLAMPFLLRTLDGYLRCGCRQKDAAEVLHVHLNTLKYRLRRITELGSVNLEDPDEMFYLRISVELDRLRE